MFANPSRPQRPLTERVYSLLSRIRGSNQQLPSELYYVNLWGTPEGGYQLPELN